MNLPNKLTVLRVLMIPFFVVFMITPLAEGNGKYIALALFCIASLTDMLDGKLSLIHIWLVQQKCTAQIDSG